MMLKSYSSSMTSGFNEIFKSSEQIKQQNVFLHTIFWSFNAVGVNPDSNKLKAITQIPMLRSQSQANVEEPHWVLGFH